MLDKLKKHLLKMLLDVYPIILTGLVYAQIFIAYAGSGFFLSPRDGDDYFHSGFDFISIIFTVIFIFTTPFGIVSFIYVAIIICIFVAFKDVKTIETSDEWNWKLAIGVLPLAVCSYFSVTEFFQWHLIFALLLIIPTIFSFFEFFKFIKEVISQGNAMAILISFLFAQAKTILWIIVGICSIVFWFFIYGSIAVFFKWLF